MRTNTKAKLQSALLYFAQIQPSGCWLWPRGKSGSGYGFFVYKEKSRPVHRLAAYVWLGMRLSRKAFVCHKCDVKSCYNPDHLFIGTAKQNTQDALNKGRFSVGQRHYCAKLTEKTVALIRRDYAAGASIAALARRYNMGETAIRKAVWRITWRHLK